MKITKKDYATFLRVRGYLEGVIESRAIEQLNTLNGSGENFSLDYIEYSEHGCVVTLCEYFCGDTDYRDVTLPLSDIICSDEDWELSLKKKVLNAEEAKKKEKAEKVKQKRAEAKAKKLRKIRELECMLSESTREEKQKELNKLLGK